MTELMNKPSPSDQNLADSGTRLMSGGFTAFLAGLAADARLGRYVSPLAGQSPEVVVLSLTQALADAAEGRQPHPALRLLQRMEGDR